MNWSGNRASVVEIWGVCIIQMYLYIYINKCICNDFSAMCYIQVSAENKNVFILKRFLCVHIFVTFFSFI